MNKEEKWDGVQKRSTKHVSCVLDACTDGNIKNLYRKHLKVKERDAIKMFFT